MAVSLLARLEAARRQRFVGRETEQALFHDALIAPELPFGLLYVFGPGGVGKTTLLRQFGRQAAQLGVQTLFLDSRNLEPAPEAFWGALRQGLGLTAADEVGSHLAALGERLVLLLDTFEMLLPIEGWLRDAFFPTLPNNVLVVLAGRTPPTAAWRTDPGWAAVMCIVPLHNLSRDESGVYLTRGQVPAQAHEAILDFTHGHPLALALVVDAFAQRPAPAFEPVATPDVIRTLLIQLVDQASSPAHRAGLEACALVRLTTEPLLASLLATPDAHELFDWLRSLSFIEADRYGLFPHDLVREALVADLGWRHPDWYAELHQRARSYYLARIQQGDLAEQGRVLAHYVYLHRHNPVVRPYFEWQTSSTLFADALRPADLSALVQMVRQHEGEVAAQLAAHWLVHQPHGVRVVREATGKAQGVLISLRLDQLTANDQALDPAVQAALSFLQQQAPLRPGETATLFRFWLARDSYQAVSPVQSRLFFSMVHHYLTTPRLAYTLLPCAQPAFWQAVFSYADLIRLEAADFIVEGRPYGVYGHDWRVVPPLAWLALLADRELNVEPRAYPTAAVEPTASLSEAAFTSAVRAALRDFTQPQALRTNPLLHSRLLLRRCSQEQSMAMRIETLQTLLQEAAALLRHSPKQAKFYRALHSTYFEPLATQEEVAEHLDVPFSTYRRHLRAGLDAVATQLWQQEME